MRDWIENGDGVLVAQDFRFAAAGSQQQTTVMAVMDAPPQLVESGEEEIARADHLGETTVTAEGSWLEEGESGGPTVLAVGEMAEKWRATKVERVEATAEFAGAGDTEIMLRCERRVGKGGVRRETDKDLLDDLRADGVKRRPWRRRRMRRWWRGGGGGAGLLLSVAIPPAAPGARGGEASRQLPSTTGRIGGGILWLDDGGCRQHLGAERWPAGWVKVRYSDLWGGGRRDSVT
uniref:Uncharacterized protein n=2 Tax=Arundo donax TaxID=35708 RepID=A0A0A9G9E4_ARUDO